MPRMSAFRGMIYKYNRATNAPMGTKTFLNNPCKSLAVMIPQDQIRFGLKSRILLRRCMNSHQIFVHLWHFIPFLQIKEITSVIQQPLNKMVYLYTVHHALYLN